MEKEESINFIAKHYRRGAFSADNGWKKLGIAKFWNFKRMCAAVSVGVIVLSAAAFAVFHNYKSTSQRSPETEQTAIIQAYTVKTIDFEQVPLDMVVKKIESVYDVKVVNIPRNADEYILSLHYEGNAYELIETINEILELNLSIEE